MDPSPRGSDLDTGSAPSDSSSFTDSASTDSGRSDTGDRDTSADTGDSATRDSGDTAGTDTAADTGPADSGADTADTAVADTGPADTGEVAAVTLASATEFVGEPGGLAGSAIAPAGDVNGDGFGDILIGAPGYDLEETERIITDPPVGMAYLVHGPFGPEGRELATAPVRFIGEQEWDMAGTSVAAGDVNGDGSTDAVIGAAMGFVDLTAMGAVYVIPGPHAGDVQLARHLFREGEYAGDWYGWRVAVGDLNSDGFDDVAVGVPQFEAFSNGKVEVYPGSGEGLGHEPLLTVHSDMVFDQFGYGVRFADIDGDGCTDLLAAAKFGDFHAEDVGVITAYSGDERATGTLYTDAATATVGGRNGSDGAGTSFAVGDTDGDGYNDLFVGVPRDDDGAAGAGAAFVVRGPFVGNVGIEDAPTAAFLGSERGEGVGTSVDIAGDVNADGAVDFIVGAPTRDNAHQADTGKAYLVLGPAAGTHVLDVRANGSTVAAFDYDRVGKTVANIGDIDMDGVPEFAFAAPYANYSGTRSGIIYLFGL